MYTDTDRLRAIALPCKTSNKENGKQVIILGSLSEKTKKETLEDFRIGCDKHIDWLRSIGEWDE